MIIKCLMVGVGGFAGSIFRYLMSLIPVLNRGDFPWQTFVVNVLGAILIGVLIKMSENAEVLSENTMLLLKVGLCGGFTTFSTFALENLNLMEQQKMIILSVYIIITVLSCIVGVHFGRQMAGLAIGE